MILLSLCHTHSHTHTHTHAHTNNVGTKLNYIVITYGVPVVDILHQCLSPLLHLQHSIL